MSGLDKMKAQIIAEAQENAKEILAQAHAQADSIIGEAKVQAEKGCTEDHRTGRSQSRRFCETPGLFIRYEKAQGST